MKDILVDRLRLAAKPEEFAAVWGLTVVRCSLLHEAADEIELLRAQVIEMKLDIEASEADRQFHDDFYTPPEDD